MISKLGVGLLLSVATLLFATPTTAHASSASDKAKIKKYTAQLKKLPNKMAPASKVNSLVTKLTKLDPKKAIKYYNLGLTKLATGPSAYADATKILASVAKVVKKAGLSASLIKKIEKQGAAANLNYTSNPENSVAA